MSFVDDFEARFPELVERYTSELVEDTIPLLEPSFIIYYGLPYGNNPKSDQAILMMAAHLLIVQLASSSNQFNQFSSNSVGNVSGSFFLPQNTTELRTFFNSTKYGQQFLLLIRSRQGGVFVWK